VHQRLFKLLLDSVVLDLQLAEGCGKRVQFALKLKTKGNFFLVIPRNLHVFLLQLESQSLFVVFFFFQLLLVNLHNAHILFESLHLAYLFLHLAFVLIDDLLLLLIVFLSYLANH
jgi:hypothetical protein